MDVFFPEVWSYIISNSEVWSYIMSKHACKLNVFSKEEYLEA
jgi:hypothetical protein